MLLERVAADEQRDASREPGEVDDALAGRVPGAGDEDVLSRNEPRILRNDVEYARAGEALELGVPSRR